MLPLKIEGHGGQLALQLPNFFGNLTGAELPRLINEVGANDIEHDLLTNRSLSKNWRDAFTQTFVE